MAMKGRAAAETWLSGLPADARSLPMASRLPDCSDILLSGRPLVLTAEPGAGKTSLLPPWLSFMTEGKVLVLQPRRSAAIQASSRCAELLGEEAGGLCGWQVRGDARRCKRTRLLFLTEALLTRMIQEDPSLEGVSVIVIDEWHERSIHADLALALALEARKALRPDLMLALMSATIDAEAAAAFLSAHSPAPAAVLAVPGRAHPVEISWRPLSERERFETAVAREIRAALDGSSGDLLCFLPGMGEINRVRSALLPLLSTGPEAPQILPLHGSLPLAEQLRVVRGRKPGDPSARRVILSTSVAQTSLTVPGVDTVVDAGLARLTRAHIPSGMDRLVTERVSAQDAGQRAGRAGRLGPGRALRLWPREEALRPDTEPEILRSDLSSLVLEASVWGARDPAALPFPDPPPPAALDRARELLEDLGLLEPGEEGACGRPSQAGLRCAKLGLGPRVGSILLASPRPLAAAAAAVLAEREPAGLPPDADLRLRLEALRTGRGADRAWIERCLREAERVRRAAGISGADWSAAEEASLGDLLLPGFPDRLGKREESGLYRFPSGRTAALFTAERGAGAGVLEGAEWIVATEVDSGQAMGIIRAAAPLSPEAVAALARARARPSFSVEWQGFRPRPRAAFLLGKLDLGRLPGIESPKPPEDEVASAIASSFFERLSREGLSLLPLSAQASSLLMRARFIAGVGLPPAVPAQSPLPDLSDQGLIAGAGEWLRPYLDLSPGPGGSWPPLVDSKRCSDALTGLLSPWRERIERETPESIPLPTGQGRRVIYDEGDDPILEARVQELFGLTVHPLVCGRRVVIRLLSPAHRPVQVTTDIAGFWAGSYAQVRKDLRGRYPKHDWPEDGASATPTARRKGQGKGDGGR